MDVHHVFRSRKESIFCEFKGKVGNFVIQIPCTQTLLKTGKCAGEISVQ